MSKFSHFEFSGNFASFIFTKKCEKVCNMRPKIFAFFHNFLQNVSFAGNPSCAKDDLSPNLKNLSRVSNPPKITFN